MNKSKQTKGRTVQSAFEVPNLSMETEDFLITSSESRDPISGADIEVYGVFNKHTDVREAEARRVVNAVALMHMLQFDLTNRVVPAEMAAHPALTNIVNHELSHQCYGRPSMVDMGRRGGLPTVYSD
jgi:hypothetical protein